MSKRNENETRRRVDSQTQDGDGRMEPAATGATLDYTGQSETNAMRDAALECAKMGFAVFPLKTVDMPGQKTPGKEPWTNHGCKDATTDAAQIRRWWEQEKPGANIGIACGAPSGGLLVLDLDAHGGPDGMDTLRKWESKNGKLPETVQALTGGGGVHLLYRTDVTFRNVTCDSLGVDIRSHGAYIVAPPSMHVSGRRYEWELEHHPDDMAIAEATPEVLAFAQFVVDTHDAEHTTGTTAEDDGTCERFKLPDHINKGGRNDTLMRYSRSLRARYLGKEEITALLTLANKRCKPPLPKDEILAIARSAMAVKAGPSASNRPKSQGPQHLPVCRALIDKHGVVIVDGVPVLTADNPLSCGWEALDRAAYSENAGLTASLFKSIHHWMMYNAPHAEAAPSKYVAFKNGVLNIETMELHAECPKGVVPVVIPHDWNPDAQPVAAVDKVLDGFADGYKATRLNLEEILGECITRGGDYCHIYFFQGSGSNGKSTFFALVMGAVGLANCAALDPNDVGERFNRIELAGKLVNIADDIGAATIKEKACMTLKSASLGGLIDGENKGEQKHIPFRPFATFLFACNEQPTPADKSEGMRRRIVIIPATAHFKNGDKDGGAALLAEITTEEAAQYALRLAVEGRRRVLANNGMTPNDRARFLEAELMRDADPVRAFVEDAELTREKLADGETLTDVFYGQFKRWCSEIGFDDNIMVRKEFTRRINLLMNLRTKQVRTVGDGRGYIFCYPPFE